MQIIFQLIDQEVCCHIRLVRHLGRTDLLTSFKATDRMGMLHKTKQVSVCDPRE